MNIQNCQYQFLYYLVSQTYKELNDWLESLQLLGVGNFDLVESSGVLHHLKDTPSGVNILKDVLVPQGGGMDVMLYGRIGRSGIYPMQRLLRIIINKNCDTPSKLRLTRKIIKRLPTSNWFVMGEESVMDHIHLGDSGTYVIVKTIRLTENMRCKN